MEVLFCADTMPVLSALKGVFVIRKAKSMLGMPVVCHGERLGRVSYVLPDEALHTISGLYFHCGVAGSRFIRFDQLELIGDLAVLTHDSGKRMQLHHQPLLRRALAQDGARIGAITDILIDEGTLRIEGLELSRGYLDDLSHGRECVRQYTVQKNGDIIVG